MHSSVVGLIIVSMRMHRATEQRGTDSVELGETLQAAWLWIVK